MIKKLDIHDFYANQVDLIYFNKYLHSKIFWINILINHKVVNFFIIEEKSIEMLNQNS